MVDDVTAEVTDLLQQLIRNACVNDGTASSGHEARSVDLLQSYFDGAASTSRPTSPRPGARASSPASRAPTRRRPPSC